MGIQHAVLSHYGRIVDHKGHKEVRTLCPFHDDTRPSLCLNENVFYCLACGAKGTMKQLVRELEAVVNGNEGDLNDWSILCIIAKIREEHKNDASFDDVEMPQISEETAILYSRMFLDTLGSPSWEKLDYHPLIQRGFTPEILTRFKVKINTTGLWPIVLPLCSNGEYIGHTQRATSSEVEPKYMYMQGMKKSHHLGCLRLKKGPLHVVEGWLDLMKLHQLGCHNVACLFGCDCSAEQEEMIIEYATEVVDWLDNDDAGRRGSGKLRQIAERNVGKYRRVEYSTNDPAELKQCDNVVNFVKTANIAFR